LHCVTPITQKTRPSEEGATGGLGNQEVNGTERKKAKESAVRRDSQRQGSLKFTGKRENGRKKMVKKIGKGPRSKARGEPELPGVGPVDL